MNSPDSSAPPPSKRASRGLLWLSLVFIFAAMLAILGGLVFLAAADAPLREVEKIVPDERLGR